ncbi:MAG: hypothetical protein WDO18_14080 [Acidobacteriota bacterium]
MKLLEYFRESPETRERKRRQAIHQNSRQSEAFILSVEDTTLYYTYSAAGVQYESSQDVSDLLDRLPVPPERAMGVALVKYAHNNPGNSILVCEQWCGVRAPQQVE